MTRKFIPTFKKPSKMRNVKTIIDGISFSSKKEANYYCFLKLERMNSKIKSFSCQVPFVFMHNNIKICSYFADFKVENNDGTVEIIDVKSKFTRKNPVYRIKNKMMKAFYNIDIKEV